MKSMDMCVLVGADRRKTVNAEAGQCPVPFTIAGYGNAFDRDVRYISPHPTLSTPYIRYTDFIESIIIRSNNSGEN